MNGTQKEKPIMVLDDVLGGGLGRMNALVKTIMCQVGTDDPNEAIRLVNSGKWVVVTCPEKWHEQHGAIDFSVTTNGKTGEKWIEYLERKKFDIDGYTKSVLRSSDFKPMKAGVTIKIVVLKGTLFVDGARTPGDICAKAEHRKLVKPNAEIACLIRDKFTDEEIEAMGLWTIVAMHDSIEVSDGYPRLLSIYRNSLGCELYRFCGNPGGRSNRRIGFAFAVAQVISP